MNPYTTFYTRLRDTLQGQLVGAYAGLEARRGIWKPRNIQPFERYLVWVAVPPSNPVVEVRDEGPKLVTEILRADVFLLVKNYDEDSSVYGDTAPNLGVLQLLSDTKTVLRNTDLDRLIQRNYREIEGGSSFETGASDGFDTGGHGWVHRARLTYTARLFPFCHPA